MIYFIEASTHRALLFSILLFDITNHSQASPLWSLNRRQSRQITGVAFSPTNPNLFGSTSADGSLMFYDKNSGETIQQLASLSSGIQSLTMHSDGFSCAVGTEAGEVLMYDLRQNMPLSSLYVQGPVKSLQFAPPPKDKQSHQNSSVQKSIIGSSNDQNQLMILKRDLDRATGQASTDFSHSGQKSVSSQRTSGHQSETCDGGNQSYAGPPLRANQSFSHNSLEPRHEPAAYGSNQNYSNPTTPQRAAQQPESSTQANGVGYSGQPPTKSPPQRSLGKPQLSPISTKPTTPPGDREEQKKHQPISQQQEDVSSYTSSLPPRYTEEKKVQEKPKVNLVSELKIMYDRDLS